MGPVKDYYAALGVDPQASEAEIRQAFRRLARRFHPDLNPDSPEAEAKFREINEAYKVLADPQRRREYDQARRRLVPADVVEGWVRIRRRVFGALFGGRPGSRTGFRTAGRSRGEDLEAEVELTLEEVFRGTVRNVEVEAARACPSCRGSGAYLNRPCHTCGGSGTVRRKHRVEVGIPRGVAEGTRVRVPEAGGAGRGGGPAGDLYLKITVKPHPIFERHGPDLFVEVPVPLTTAVLGGEVTVPTLDGPAKLNLPAETQNGRVFCLPGLGLPDPHNPECRGDLYARVRVVLPRNLSPEQRQLFEHLRRLETSG